MELGDYEWGGNTHPNIRATAESDGSIVVLPVGSLEQHGYHMPTITDSLLVDAVANFGAERVQDDVPVTTLPPLWTGISPHHLDIGATISLNLDTMLDMIKDIADSAMDNGFDAFLIVNGHGGNIPIVSSAPQEIGPEHPSAQILAITYWTLIDEQIESIRDSKVGGISHGGEFETSLMMYLQPELVDEDKIEVNYHESSYEQTRSDLYDPGNLSIYRSSNYHTDTGVDGDPSLASKQKGEQIFKTLGDKMENLLVNIHDETA